MQVQQQTHISGFTFSFNAYVCKHYIKYHKHE
jgi:hypothetical protein